MPNMFCTLRRIIIPLTQCFVIIKIKVLSQQSPPFDDDKTSHDMNNEIMN